MGKNNLFLVLILVTSFYSKGSHEINDGLGCEYNSTIYFGDTFMKVNQKARFILAFNRTMKFEGNYANDKSDRGGETYKGIARKFHPTWGGWNLVDSCKISGEFPKNLLKVVKLEELVEGFYKKEYWDKIHGDEIASQELANDLFDSCVNMGLSGCIKLFQKTLNVPTTGVMDEKTLRAINNK